jgi:hypothetical protein
MKDYPDYNFLFFSYLVKLFHFFSVWFMKVGNARQEAMHMCMNGKGNSPYKTKEN